MKRLSVIIATLIITAGLSIAQDLKKLNLDDAATIGLKIQTDSKAKVTNSPTHHEDQVNSTSPENTPPLLTRSVSHGYGPDPVSPGPVSLLNIRWEYPWLPVRG